MWSVSLRRACKDDGGDHRSQLPRQRQPQHAADRPRQAQLRKLTHKLHKAQGDPSCRLTRAQTAQGKRRPPHAGSLMAGHSMKKLAMPAPGQSLRSTMRTPTCGPLSGTTHHGSPFPSLQMCEP